MKFVLLESEVKPLCDDCGENEGTIFNYDPFLKEINEYETEA